MQHLLHDCTLNPVSYERLCIVFDVCHLLYDQRFLKNDKFTSRCIFGDHSSLKRLGERSLLQIIHWLRQYAGTVKLWILTCIIQTKIYLLSKCLMVLYFSNMQSILGWKSERASRSECQPLHVVWRVLEIQGTRAFWLISCFYL